MKLQLRLTQYHTRKRWVVVTRIGGFIKTTGPKFRSKRAAERFATEQVMVHPDLIGGITVEPDEEKC